MTMISKGPRLLLVGITLLAIASATAVALDSLLSAERPHAEEFQRMLGGFGLGPAIDLGGCPLCFDARATWSCKEDAGAVPGARFFCRHHACSVFRYSPIVHVQAAGDKDGER